MSPQRYQVHSLAELQVIAEEHGCTLIIAGPDELLLDIDAAVTLEAWKAKYSTELALLQEKFGYRRFDSWPSRNGGLHVRIRLSEVIPTSLTMALQAALGSDPKREILACWEFYALSTASLHEDPIGEVEDTRSLFKPKEKE